MDTPFQLGKIELPPMTRVVAGPPAWREHQWVGQSHTSPHSQHCRVCGQSAITCVDINRCPGPREEPERQALRDLAVREAQVEPAKPIIVDPSDPAVRAALISLGWTPP